MNEQTAFVQDLLTNLDQKRTHLAVFRMWCQEKQPPECDTLFNKIIQNTKVMIDLLIETLRRYGQPIPDHLPNPRFIAEARKQPNSEARVHFAERFLRRSLAWYEERLSRATSPEEREVWERLFELEANNWALAEDYINP